MEKQPDSRMCFVCGIDNPIGLKLKFNTDDEGRCIARFQPKPEHQAYPLICMAESCQPYLAKRPTYRRRIGGSRIPPCYH
jgi:hypothetical protein